MKLLEIDSTAYLKRLVRELNKAGMLDGFYASVATFSLRCNKARFKNGVIECHSPSASPKWFTPAVHRFSDCNGAEIVACRVVKH